MILLTGGCGFIGSHTHVALAVAGLKSVILDNLSNSLPAVLDRLAVITGQRPVFVEGDVRDGALLRQVLRDHGIDTVIHFAGLKAVGESVVEPLAYYDNNVTGTLTLLDAMRACGVGRLVFSSSATVYGDPASVPVREEAPRAATNPYGRSKLMIEEILEDVYRADGIWRMARLRYFNPVGAHESGLIGEDPQGVPNNLLPFLAQVGIGQRACLNVFGADYPTPDGTGVRDYIHVMDLAEGHVAALTGLKRADAPLTLNIGTGRGYSVLEMIRAFEAASGRRVPYQVVGRRPGDVAQCWADPAEAWRSLGWRARRGLDQMCADAWRWQLANPTGYR